MTNPTEVTCVKCNKPKEIAIYAAQLKDWVENRSSLPLIQDHFPHLSAEDRELLISGICPMCWEEMWGPTPFDGEQS